MDFCLKYISEDVTKTKHDWTKQLQQTKISEEQEIFIMSNLAPQLCYHLWMLECNIFMWMSNIKRIDIIVFSALFLSASEEETGRNFKKN